MRLIEIEMNSKQSIVPAKVSEEFVFSKRDYFVDVHLWPRETRLNTEGWLSNFKSSEHDHAIHLLNAFLFYSTELTDELFKAAFHSLSRFIIAPQQSYVFACSAWNRFRESAIVTHVTGENPSNSDSGFIFARKARQLLGIDESNLRDPGQALELLVQDSTKPLIFVDDFAGSGDQFIRTWKRQQQLSKGMALSFKRYSEVRSVSFYYCPLFCSAIGRDAIERECPEVVLSPAHYLPEKYSAISSESVIWPEHLKKTSFEFIEEASARAGIPDYCEIPWTGYQDQALTIAFEHGIPDATLPIFYFDENGWVPLMKRT
jgi:hypothetical protein